MSKKYLPIGTIVKLKDIDKLAMIGGYFPSGASRPDYVWDYSGFAFPEGMIGNDQILQFDNESIEKIIVMGYQDATQMSFIRVVMSKADEIKAYGKRKMEEANNSEVTE